MEEGRGGVRAASGISFREDRGNKEKNQSALPPFALTQQPPFPEQHSREHASNMFSPLAARGKANVTRRETETVPAEDVSRSKREAAEKSDRSQEVI